MPRHLKSHPGLKIWTLCFLSGSVLILSLSPLWGDYGTPEETFEEEIHQHQDSKKAGFPRQVAQPASKNAFGGLDLKIVDSKTGKPVFCRVNVVGADGNYYQPAESSLSPWSLQKVGNRPGKGPFRYLGWFFYSDGTDQINLCPGRARIEVWKGFEYRPVQMELDVIAGKTQKVQLRLPRVVNMASKDWYSGDTHIHMNRQTPEDDQRILDLLEAEDIRFGHILCMNDTRTYHPTMARQEWLQIKGTGPGSEVFRGNYGIVSGQEYRCGTFGHIKLLGAKRLVDADGVNTNPNNWPPFGLVSDETHSLGGYSLHAHGGYEKEIYADFAQQATDGVELLQFAVYRGIGLEGWYHILNAGFAFPAEGASDYPYCRKLGDCRTYAWVPGKEPGEKVTIDDWNHALRKGHSFFTTGPLVDFRVNGKRPGETVQLTEEAAESQTLKVAATILSPTAPVQELQLIRQGKILARQEIDLQTAGGGQNIQWEVEIPAENSCWLALRAWAPSQSGKENVEAHTNPVYVEMGQKKQVTAESLEWLIDKLDGQIKYHSERPFPQREQVLKYFQKSREILSEKLKTVKAEN